MLVMILSMLALLLLDTAVLLSWSGLVSGVVDGDINRWNSKWW